jgi:hypothetical protein
MIACRFIIKELPNGSVAFLMEPEDGPATAKEALFTSVIEIGVNEACKHALERAGRGEMIEGKNIAAHVRMMLEKNT